MVQGGALLSRSFCTVEVFEHDTGLIRKHEMIISIKKQIAPFCNAPCFFESALQFPLQNSGISATIKQKKQK